MQRFLFSLIRTWALAGLLMQAVCAHSAAEPRNVLVLGDSISAAYGMSLQQGWVALLQQELLSSSPGHTVVNASISGETTQGGLRRLPALLEEQRYALVIVELGANDGLRGYPLSDLRANLTQLVTLAQQQGAAVILLPMEIPPNYGARYTSGFRETYRQVAAATGSVLGAFILDGVATEPRLMQSDGIHPTVEAQPQLLENVLPAIAQALGTL